MPVHSLETILGRRPHSTAWLLAASLIAALTTGSPLFAQEGERLSAEQVAQHARAVWESGHLSGALDLLGDGIQAHPDALALYKLRGDILATSRRPREAVQAYETVLARKPNALDVRWAKWSVLVRSGRREEALAELRHIAQIDPRNPLIYLRLAQELRKIDRLEDSLASFKKAVELAPDLLGWRLGLARARFDVLDYPGAYDEVEYVLQRVPAGSPLEIPAKNLQAMIYGPTVEKGRRFDHITPSKVTPEQRKEWAMLRGDAWRLFEAGRYAEAEPVYRKLLALNPNDPTAVHQLGLTLMELDRCQEAINIFGKISNLNPSDEEYADTVFRMGVCLVKLKQWSEALIHFQVLYDAAVQFEESIKGRTLPGGTRVLSKEKMAEWIEEIRPHVPDAQKPAGDQAARSAPPAPEGIPEQELYEKIAAEPMEVQKPLDKRASLMGRDADFSWFRFLIPASQVMRDDFPTGEHDFIPLNPGDSFPTTQKAIYLVFGLVASSYDAVPITAQCALEISEVAGEARAVLQDRVVMSMSDQSGYFMLTSPKTGWMPGLYRCGFYVGERITADTHVDEVRFRVVASPQTS